MPFYIETTKWDDDQRYYAMAPDQDTADKAQRLLFPTEGEARTWATTHGTDGAIHHTGRALDMVLMAVLFIVVAALAAWAWFYGSFPSPPKPECEYLVQVCKDGRPV